MNTIVTKPDSPVTPLTRTHTFGTPNATLGVTPLQRQASRAVSPAPSQETRPQVQRGTSEYADADGRIIYSSGIFADPKPKKAFGLGAELFTDGHRRLILGLREEAGRLHSYNKRIMNRLEEANSKLRVARSQVTDLKAEVRIMRNQLEDAGRALEDAHDTIQEMETKRQNRMSRIYQAIQDAEGVTIQAAQHARRVSVHEHRMD